MAGAHGRGPFRSELATPLARERVRAGLTQAELARWTGLSVETIRRLEGGHEKEPRLRPLVNIARVLDLPVERLLEERWRWTSYYVNAAAPPDPRKVLKPRRWLRWLELVGIEPRMPLPTRKSQHRRRYRASGVSSAGRSNVAAEPPLQLGDEGTT